MTEDTTDMTIFIQLSDLISLVTLKTLKALKILIDRKADRLPPVPIANSTTLMQTTKESNIPIISEKKSKPYENILRPKSIENNIVNVSFITVKG